MGTKSKHESDEPSLESLAREASQHFSAARWDEAARLFEQVRARQPSPGVCSNLGYCYQNLGRHEDAVRYFELCLADLPDHANALRASCFSYCELRRFDAMLRCARRVTELVPQGDYGWQQLAIAQLEAGDAEASLASSSRALALNADNPYAHFCAAVARQVGGKDGAMDALERAVALSPSFAAAMSVAAREDKRLETLASSPRAQLVARWAKLAEAVGAEDEARLAAVRGDPALREERVGDLTLLMLAARDGKTRAVSALLDAGAEVDAVNGTGLDARHFAALGAHREAALALDRRGARATWARAPELASWLAEPHRHVPLPALHPALQPFGGAIAATMQPAWLMRADKTDNVSPTESHFGGRRPFVPQSLGWPLCPGCKNAMLHFVQVDFADLPTPLPGLPERGLWQLFACHSCEGGLPGYYCSRWSPDFQRASATGEELVTGPDHPQALARIVFEPFVSVPSANSSASAIASNGDEQVFAVGEGDDDEDKQRLWAVHNFTPGFHIEDEMISRLGGHPPWIQPEEAPAPCRAVELPRDSLQRSAATTRRSCTETPVTSSASPARRPPAAPA